VNRLGVKPRGTRPVPPVDPKGRIVLRKEVCQRLDLESGTEVEVREEDGKATTEEIDAVIP